MPRGHVVVEGPVCNLPCAPAERELVVPEVAVRVEEKVLVYPDRRPKQVRVKLKSNVADEASGTLRLRLPAGWAAAPAEVPVTLKGKGAEAAATFNVTPPADAST